MKSTTVALAFMAASAEALLCLDVNLPLGISLEVDLLCPDSDPCPECVDTWHPPHDVIIDDCDDTHNGDWHWVHPCPETHEPEYTWATSTLTATQTSTIMECGLEVANCPGSSTTITTVAISEQTTIYPVPVTSAPPAGTATATAGPSGLAPTSTGPAPPVQTSVISQPPSISKPGAEPETYVVPTSSPSSMWTVTTTTWTGSHSTLSTAVNAVVPGPSAALYPPGQGGNGNGDTPAVPTGSVPAPGQGSNGTTARPPFTAGAAQNSFDLVAAVAAVAAYMLYISDAA